MRLMLSQFGALLLIAVVTATPVARTACEMSCAAQGNGTPSHSCHEHGSESALAISGVHHCGHDEEQPASSSITALPDGPAAMAVVIEPPAIYPGPISAHLRVVTHSPPASLNRTPLRI